MSAANKKSLSERDICTKFITPALVKAGWDVQVQIREEAGFTNAPFSTAALYYLKLHRHLDWVEDILS